MKILKKTTVALVLTVLAVLVLAFLPTANAEALKASETEIGLMSEERVVIATNGSCDYGIVFSSDSNQADMSIASELSRKIASRFEVSVTYRSDLQASTASNEILIGNTDRQLSKDLLAYLEAFAPSDEYFVWGYVYRDGSLAYTGNSNSAINYGKSTFFSLITDDGFSVINDEYVVSKKLISEYEKELKDAADAAKEAERQAKLEKIAEMQAAFTQSQFGEYVPMIGENGHYQESPYPAPWFYPSAGQHPRLVINESDIETIKALLQKNEYADLAANFWKLADADCEFGIFPEKVGKSGEIYRFNDTYLGIMTCKALAYLITGDELYALEAIVSIKNAMLTYKYTADIHSDIYHGGSEVMFAVSIVYDWCHDRLTEADKDHILAGIPNLLISTMEIDYPPTNMGYISGHGTGPQFLRDMMVVTTAVYDEAPDWWELVAGRYFNYYLPVANLSYGTGWVSQGTANYAYNKILVQLWAAMCVFGSTGEIVLNEDANLAEYFLLSHTMPESGNYFQTGDGSRTANGASRSWEYSSFFLASALYKDPVVFANAKAMTKDFSVYTTNAVSFMPPSLQLGFISVYMRDGEDTGVWRYEGIPLVQYFDGPAGQMTARNSWTDGSAAVAYMKIGTMTMANHDSFDHGTFQIYYKGLLACSSGAYAKYGGYIHKYYLQATVSSNGLLIFNPAFADTEPQYGKNADGTDNTDVINNHKRYFYSGGQEHRSEAGSYEEWTGGKYNMAEMMGASSGYNSDGSAKYGYIAGDITSSYSDQTVEFVSRRMLTIYTGDAEFPMIFLTYDNITSVDPEFEKTYLLHTIKEPEINETDKIATVVQSGGKMYVHSLYGADSISKIGGAGYAYWINGKNCTDQYKGDDSASTIWGRIELKASGEASTGFLTAMYVTDADNTNTMTVKGFESDSVHVAKIGNEVAVFAKSDVLAYKELSFSFDADGLYNYYVSGVEAGTWDVRVDGVLVAHSYSSAGEGILTFTAPAGKVTVTPGKDVIGANGGKIQYNTLGGTLPDDVSYIYNNEVETPLPVPTKENGTFLGWYTTSTFDEGTLVEFVPIGFEGVFRVWAKWIGVYIDEDYTANDVDIKESNKTVDGISYSSASKPGAAYTTYTDDNGVRYLLWQKGTSDPGLAVPAGTNNITNTGVDDKCISYTLKFSKNGDDPVTPLTIRMIANTDVNGTALSPTSKINLLSVNSAGEIKSGNNVIMQISSDKITTLRFVLDFKNLEMRIFDERYNPLLTKSISIPAATGAKTGEELMKCFTKYMIHFYASSGGEGDQSIRIYGIRIEDSDVFTPLIPNIENPINYVLNGGDLPNDAPIEYLKTEPTPLPEPSREGAVFSGWYTSSDFAEDTAVTEVPKDTEGEYTVYAKWYCVLLDEDYSETEISIVDSNKTTGGINYAANSNPDVSYITKLDADNIRYLEWKKGTGDPALALVGTGNNLTNTTASEISVTVRMAKNGDEPLANLDVNLVANRDVSGNTLSSSAKIKVFVLTDGVLKLGGRTEVMTVTDEIATLRLVIDFEDLEMRAYNDNGEVIATNEFAIPDKTLAKTGKELMTCFNQRMIHFRATSSEEAGSIRFYGFRVADGDEFYRPPENPIGYDLNGGSLPTGYPVSYDKETPTILPTPTRAMAVFAGWYTTSTFEEGTLVTSIPISTEGTFSVYAKWYAVYADEDYSATEVSVSEKASSINGITYNGKGYAGSAFNTMTDDQDRPYLLWTKGTEDPALYVPAGEYNLTHSTERVLSITLTIAKDGDNPNSQIDFRLIANHNVNGEKLSNSAKTTFANLNGSGKITLAGKTEIGDISTGELVTMRIAIDFENKVMIAYDENGEVIATEAFSYPASTGAQTAEEMMKCYTQYIFHCYSNSSSGQERSIRFYGIRAEEGNVFVK